MLVPSPARIWREYGLTRCSCCARRARCVATWTSDGMVEHCFGCVSATGLSSQVRAMLYNLLQTGWRPSDPREAALLDASDLDSLHEDLMEAIRYRFFMTPTEVRAEGHPSLEGAVNKRCRPALWLLDPSYPDEARPVPWVARLLRKVPGKRIRHE